MTQSYNLSQLANNLNTAGQLDATDGLVGALPAANGGTGIVSYTNGDILVANGATAFNALADIATGNALISGGIAAPPSYGKIGLTTHVSGTLPVANGGTGITAAGTSGNALVSTGSAWASTTLPPDLASINATVASNNLSLTLNAPWAADFRSTTLSSGSTSRISISANITLSVPSGATLGSIVAITTGNAAVSRLVLLAITNATIGSTAELAVVNIAGGNNLDETTLINTTAISAAATSANTIYSTTARTACAFRVVGYVQSTQATAGAWAAAPSTVQGAGGNAVTAMSSIGYGQTRIDVTASRAIGAGAAGTIYYNTTGKPIQVYVYGQLTSGNDLLRLTTGSVEFYGNQTTNLASQYASIMGIILPGESYSVRTLIAGITSAVWIETR